MSKVFFRQMFGASARALQQAAGSRSSYAAREAPATLLHDELTGHELAFLASRDSVYLASVTADGWPYVQHRGGPPGFIRSLGGNVIGLPDYPGNRQFISSGNIMQTRRVAMFCMDYPARRRLKLVGHARVVTAAEDATVVDSVTDPAGPPAGAALLIDVMGLDWNCPKYIEPRFTRTEIERQLVPLREENAQLRAELACFKEDAA